MNSKILLLRILKIMCMCAAISSLLYLYAYKEIWNIKKSFEKIDGTSGITYFHESYGEDEEDMDLIYSQKEQNAIYKQMINMLRNGKYDYLVDYPLGFGNIETIVINSNAIDYFGINKHIAKGKSINDVTFNDENIVIPALLGSDLCDNYKIGEKINVYVYDQKIQFQIYGVLESSINMDFIYFSENLDNAIIIPEICFTNEPQNEEICKMQNYFLSSVCNNYFIYNSDQTYEEIIHYCGNIAKKLKVKWTCTPRIINEYKNMPTPMDNNAANILIVIIYLILSGTLAIGTINDAKRILHAEEKVFAKFRFKNAILFLLFLIVSYESTYRVMILLMETSYANQVSENRASVIFGLLILAIFREVTYEIISSQGVKSRDIIS